jgi:hypothetical protein
MVTAEIQRRAISAAMGRLQGDAKVAIKQSPGHRPELSTAHAPNGAFQYGSRLFLHGMAVYGRPDAQTPFHMILEISDRYARHDGDPFLART